MSRFHLDQSFGAAWDGNVLRLVSPDSDAAFTKFNGHLALSRTLPIHESSRSRHPSPAAAVPARRMLCRASHRMAPLKGGPRDLIQVAVASYNSSDLWYCFRSFLTS